MKHELAFRTYNNLTQGR